MCTNIRYRVFKGNCRPLESDELYLTQKETYIQNSNTILSFHKGKGLSTWLASQRDRGKATVWVRLHKRFAQLSFGQHYLSNFRTLIFDMFSTTNNVWLLTLLVQSEDNEILHRQWSTSRCTTNHSRVQKFFVCLVAYLLASPIASQIVDNLLNFSLVSAVSWETRAKEK